MLFLKGKFLGSSLKTGRLSWLSNRLSISKQQQHSTTAKIGDSHSPSAGRKSLDNSSSSGASASTASVGSARSLREDRRSLQKLCQNPEGLPIFMVKCIRSIEKVSLLLIITYFFGKKNFFKYRMEGFRRKGCTESPEIRPKSSTRRH